MKKDLKEVRDLAMQISENFLGKRNSEGKGPEVGACSGGSRV